ncbi:hypothetical protein FC83_GL000259 [Agrilactobacillus composti DSM 18527 = JCM 14202]|uniref:N-acetyltransferase domain-containing protein n=1 Tax=Agrilactobacillus composti DSM 18527 = JCM 14202 TaxID=1423734 RepID=X0PHP3_9LACO|nr:GNAT family N-acetyltransferase [Agrilactobacillus composti]KRM32694.1 hypothetical protein FC83_GL000259 [Agrilactobacillus composti DSM 18527 = JCM 14202]GAF41674.1 GNAT family acetyltransferase YjcF [Agrilactobacillus composti DSM 18527 = JCM 14202]
MDLFFGHLPWEKAASMYVRMQVFVLERGIAIADEFEDDQFPNAEYVVIFDGKEPVATSRLFFTEEFARFTRICVVKTQRQAHLGSQLLRQMEQASIAAEKYHVLIHAEHSAIGFYQRNGYKISSKPYLEDGVECVDMTKTLDPSPT